MYRFATGVHLAFRRALAPGRPGPCDGAHAV